jgi:hypothetical protein
MHQALLPVIVQLELPDGAAHVEEGFGTAERGERAHALRLYQDAGADWRNVRMPLEHDDAMVFLRKGNSGSEACGARPNDGDLKSLQGELLLV